MGGYRVSLNLPISFAEGQTSDYRSRVSIYSTVADAGHLQIAIPLSELETRTEQQLLLVHITSPNWNLVNCLSHNSLFRILTVSVIKGTKQTTKYDPS